MSSPRTQSNLWFDCALLVSEKYHPQLLFDEFESRLDAGCGNLAHLEAASSHRMFLEDAQIDLAYSCEAIAREWSVHGIADQGVCLFVGTPFASPSTVFQIDDHPDHAQAESGSRFERRADDAFSRSISHNLRISGEIRQFGTISNMQCS